MRPGKVTADTAEAGYAEAAEDIVEQAVHLAVQRQQRVMVGLLVALGADRNGKPVFLPAPGYEITNGHDGHLLSGWNGSWPAGPPKRRDRQTVGQGSGRFAGLVLGASMRSLAVVLPAIAILRGFMASGTTRLSAIESRPFSKRASPASMKIGRAHV